MTMKLRSDTGTRFDQRSHCVIFWLKL